MIHKIFLLLICLIPSLVNAQEAVTLSVAPTLYDMSAEPGQRWQSNLKIINVNNFDLTVYIEVVNFVPRGEGGDVRFIPVNPSEASGSTLAEWFTITNQPIIVPREKTVEVPLTVDVPVGASPGGHYAAILVGTKPLLTDDSEANLKTAQIVTSLFFARVAGAVIESGSIREFTTTKKYLSSPEVTFSLRFENKGNVDLQPQGDIKIYNMWGQERGTIPINQYTNFGKVTRDSIRNFNFVWKGEWSISDIGRYSAVTTLGFGLSEKSFASAKTYFWVIPFKLLLGILAGFSIFFFILTWLVRLYIRHMLRLAGINIEDYQTTKNRSVQIRQVPKRLPIHAPVKAGILDLSNRLKASVSFQSRFKAILNFIYQYRLFFLALFLVFGFITVIIFYVTEANTKQRAYEVQYMNHEATTSINSEEIIYNQLRSELPNSDKAELIADGPKLILVNRSGTPGIGAKKKLELERAGYVVTELGVDFSSPQQRTFIVYPGYHKDKALDLSKLLGNALVSVDEKHQEIIYIYLGSDVSQ